MKTLLKVSNQTAWQIAGKAITSLSTFIILGLVSRNFGPSGTGVFTLAFAYLAFFYTISDFGLNAYTMPKLIGKNISSEWQRLLGLRLILSIVLLLVALGIALFWPGVDLLFRQSVFIGLLAIIASSAFITASAIFQSKLRFDFLVVANTVQALLAMSVIYLITTNHGSSVSSLMFGHLLGWVACALLSLLFIRKFVKVLPIFDLTYFKNTLTQVWPISLTLVLNIVYFRIDAFILSSYRTFAEVGVYNLSYQIFQTLIVLPTFIMNVFYPIMLQEFAENLVRFKVSLVKAIAVMSGIALIGTFLTIILSPWVINILTNDLSFSGASKSLQILSFGFPAFFVSSVLMWTLVVYKKYKTLLLIYAVVLVFNVIANFIFIPQYSYLAASTITVLSEYLILLLQVIFLLPLLLKK